ncbi:glutamine amidotransferase-related protein [Kiloniella sp.]|uniref:glutamine amidotransferase-related protein n=1 Tax=Kiloniella sp. TaxID=1938587 RepID=UPI003B023839
MKEIIVIEHHTSPELDRGQQHLVERGFSLRTVSPYLGERLPELTENTAGVMILGGAQYVTQTDEEPYLQDEMAFVREVMTRNIPLLGVCLGAQLIACHLGAKVGPHSDNKLAFGYHEVLPTEEGQSFLPVGLHVLAGNRQGFELPAGATRLASGPLFPNQAFRVGKTTYAIQSHPEVTRSILDQWQELMAANIGEPGTHTKAQQDADFEKYSGAAFEWYIQFLDRLFGRDLI